jgi:hypothetical protein
MTPAYVPPGGIVKSVVAGSNITVVSTDPTNPVVSSGLSSSENEGVGTVAIGAHTTILTTDVLGIGTWLVTAVLNIQKVTAGNAVTVNLLIEADTAVATISGGYGVQLEDNTAVNNNQSSVTLSSIVVITTPGTLKITGASGVGWFQATVGGGAKNGYTAIKIV